MKTFNWRGALMVVLALAAAAGAQTVWDGKSGADATDTMWYITPNANTTGDGSVARPFKISAPSQLAGLAQLVNSGRGGAGYTMSGKYFLLVGDVALNNTEKDDWKDKNDNNRWVPIGRADRPFQGTFDGGGFTVRGVYIVDSGSAGSDYVGLFGNVNNMGKINKLRVAESHIVGRSYVGGLVGSDSGSVTDCYSTATVVGSGDYVGGLAGAIKMRGAITNSYATGSVKGGSYVGGLVGKGEMDTIRGGYATGNVEGRGDCVGGLVGHSKGGYIINAYATGNVTGGAAGDYTGGLAGWSESVETTVGTAKVKYPANIVNCYAIGKVKGRDFVGGLVGRKSGAAIRNSYAAGAVDGRDSVGGLVGYAKDATITYGYYAVDAAVAANPPGVNPCDPADAGCGTGNVPAVVIPAPKGLGIPKRSEDMKKEAFVSLLNVAAYALKNNTYREATNKWYYLSDQYPKLSIDSVTAAVFASCFAPYGNGDYGNGTDDKPYLIKTKQHLENLAVYVNCGADLSKNGSFRLENDIFAADTSGWTDWSADNGPEDEWTPIGQQPSDTVGQPPVRFNGTFDGNGFVIYGVYVNKAEDSTFAGRYQGLFGRVERTGAQGGVIKNLGVSHSYIHGYCYVGGLAGWNKKGAIIHSYIKNAKIEAWGGINGAGGIGGLVGMSDSSAVVINSYAEADVTGEINMAGGLVGWNSGNSRISYCHTKESTVSVIGDDVGGLVGRNDGSTVRNSYTNVNVSSVKGGSGANSKGGNVVGGLVGMNFNATVTKCYASGTIGGNSSLGGLVGSKMSNGKVDSSYYRDDPTTRKNDYGDPLPDSTMRNKERYKEVYKGWDFDNIWAFEYESKGYPYLGMRRAPAPKIIKQPMGGKVDVGKQLTFRISAVEVSPMPAGNYMSYQWYLNGASKTDGTPPPHPLNTYGAIVPGAINTFYTVPESKTDKDTLLYYYVVVTNTEDAKTAKIEDSLIGSRTTSVASEVAKVVVGNYADAVLSFDREIPKRDSNKTTASVSPVAVITAEFTAGPNPASKSAGAVSFFRAGKRISSGELWVYDASGDAIKKIRVSDAEGGKSTRKVGSWDLTDAKGREVSGGAYLVRGTVVTDGKRERVAVIVGVVR